MVGKLRKAVVTAALVAAGFVAFCSPAAATGSSPTAGLPVPVAGLPSDCAAPEADPDEGISPYPSAEYESQAFAQGLCMLVRGSSGR